MGLKLVNINKSFGLPIANKRKKILSNVSMEIRDGEMVAIVGRRGSGKTTLMNIMTGLNRQDSGRYIIDDHAVTFGRTFIMANFRAKKCGIITKKSLLVSDLTLFENITMPLNHRLFMTRKKKLKRAREVLRGLGLKGKGRFYPTEFSTLDRQKICAGRAMIAEPKYIFADEPTAGLTATDVDRYMDFLEVLNSAGYTIIVFTYSKRVASHCHRMIPITGEEVSEEKEAYADDFAEPSARKKAEKERIEEAPESPEIPEEITDGDSEPVSPEVHEILGEGMPDASDEEPSQILTETEVVEELPKAEKPRRPGRRRTTQESKKTTDEDE